MFKRRHPYLFSFLVLCAISGFCLIVLGGLGFWAMGGGGLDMGARVGLIEIKGMITDSRHIVSSLAQFRKDPDIKAIVLRVDSPGGTVGPAQEIYREMEKTVKKKKVIVSMGSVAASGGYYVSANASGIMANPGTITGSIGVIMAFTNLQGLMDKVGLRPVVIKSGKFKDLGSPTRPMTPEEEKILNDTVKEMYGQFVQAVSKGRKIPQEKVELIADGRIFTGQKAKDLGLVDRIGNLEDAITWAGELGGIKGEVPVEYARKKGLSLLEDMMLSATRQVFQNSLSPAPDLAYFLAPI